MDWVYIVGKLVVALILMTIALVVVAFLVYFERKTAAHMQARIGPNRAGPLGSLQSFADLLKMLKKENTMPGSADKWIFWMAPAIATLTSLGALAIIPIGPSVNQPGYLDLFGWVKTDWFIAADVNVGALVALALSSLGVYGIIMGGWGSNSKYPLLGGLRSSAQVISYEITLGISLVGVFLLSHSLNFTHIVSAQIPIIGDVLRSADTPGIWFVLLQPVAFLVFVTSMVAETNRTPFDLPEAESELVSGYHTEYSGIKFGLFFLSEYIAMVVVSSVATTCFLGGWLSPFDALMRNTDIPFISGLLGSGAHWFVLKLAGFIFFYYWLRWTLPRFRYDQLMGLCWKVFLPLTLLNIMIISVLRLLFFPPGTTTAQYTGNQFYWWIIVVIELIFGALVVYGFSRFAGLSWFGKAERPALVDRSLIMVRNVKPGRGIIEGEARTVK